MPNEDFVSRQWLIDEYHRRHKGPPGGALTMIEEAPAADVEPKSEIVPWKVAGTFYDFHQCTKCGNMWPIFSTVEWAYCPVCGCRKFPDPPKSWMDNPWCNAIAKALESLKGEDDGEIH